MFKISDFLEKARQKKQNVYFICDAAQVSGQIAKYLKYLKTYDNDVEVISFFSGSEWGNAPLDCSPLLFNFELSNNDQEYIFFESLLNISESIQVVMTEQTSVDFVKKMKDFLNIEIENDGSYLFRWYDPRVLKIANKIFTKDQRELLFKDILSWRIFVRGYYSDYQIVELFLEEKNA